MLKRKAESADAANEPRKKKSRLQKLAEIFADCNLTIVTDNTGVHKLWNGSKLEGGVPSRIMINWKKEHVRHLAYEHFRCQAPSPGMKVACTCPHRSCLEHLVELYHCQTHSPTNDMFAKITDEQRSYYLQRIASQSKETDSGCRIWLGHKDRDGYGVTHLFGRRFRAHVAVLSLHLKRAIKEGLLVCHSCGVRDCNERSHLREGTRQENGIDSIAHGTSTAKITPEHALEIFQTKGRGTQTERAQQFGVKQCIVGQIDSGNAWSHVTGAEKPTKSKRDKNAPFDFNYDVAIKVIEAKVQKDPVSGCWWWQGHKNKSGYGTMKFNGESHLAHRIAFYAANRKPIPPKTSGLLIRHIHCRNKCCCPDHVQEGTPAENMADRKRDGTHTNGKATKITDQMAKAIRDSKGDGTQRQRAARFEVTLGIVSSIDSRQTWKNI